MYKTKIKMVLILLISSFVFAYLTYSVFYYFIFQLLLYYRHKRRWGYRGRDRYRKEKRWFTRAQLFWRRVFKFFGLTKFLIRLFYRFINLFDFSFSKPEPKYRKIGTHTLPRKFPVYMRYHRYIPTLSYRSIIRYLLRKPISMKIWEKKKARFKKNLEKILNRGDDD